MRDLVLLLAGSLLLLPWSLVDGGVLGLTKFFRQKYKHAWIEIEKNDVHTVEHCAIDMNQVLHSRMKTASKNPVHFMASLFSQIDSILRTVRPTKTLVLAFDGPAPFCKMQTQRSRRKISPAQSLFTPGTDIMNAMENLMLCYVLQRVNRPEFRDLAVFISGASVPGEGELKIVEWINNHMPNHNESLIICGSDSDIILQAICLEHVPNLLIMQSGTGVPTALCNVTRVVRELQKRPDAAAGQQQGVDIAAASRRAAKAAEGGSVGGAGDNGDGHGGDGGEIMKGTKGVPENAISDTEDAKDLPTGETSEPGGTISSHSFRFDMMVLFTMQGNDYLPKLRTVTISRAQRAYDQAMLRLPPEHQGFLLDPHPPSPVANVFAGVTNATSPTSTSTFTSTSTPNPLITSTHTSADASSARGNAFNFIALWTFLDELSRLAGGGSVIPLPVQPPTLMSTLQTLCQRYP